MKEINMSRKERFDDSAVVITGASRGIGREIALAFAGTTGHPLWLIARDTGALESVRGECLEKGASSVEFSACDLTDSDGVKTLMYPDGFPAPGILVNNAGTFLLKRLEKTTPEEFRQQWEINTLAPFQLAMKLLPLMRSVERGLVLQISSIGALTGLERSGAYSSSKHAVLGFSRSLRKELEGSRIAVTALNLGQTMSTSWEGVDVDPSELIDPADVGQFIVAVSRLSWRTVAGEITLHPSGGRRSPD
ncbi:MAG: SDR family oxidoreductase [Balneolaceae bacterium]